MARFFSANFALWKRWIGGVALACALAPASGLAATASASVDSEAAAPPSRVLSLSLASDEIAVELLKRAGEQRRIIGLSSLANDRQYSNIDVPAAQALAPSNVTPEWIVELRPDVIFAAQFNRPELLRTARHLGVAVVLLKNFRSFADVSANIGIIGTSLRLPREALALQQEFAGEVEQLRASSRPDGAPVPRVVNFENDGTVMGFQSLFDDIVRAAGGVNLAASKGVHEWARIAPEAISGWDPDVIVAAGEERETPAILARLRSTPGWGRLQAVRRGRVIVIPGRKLFATSHHVTEAVRMLRTGLDAYALPARQAPTTLAIKPSPSPTSATP